MLYRKMPKTNDEISILGYGCMRFPTKAGIIDKPLALKQIRSAIDAGVNYLDTAYPYHGGASESFLGEYVLKDGYREKVKIATKLPTFLCKKSEDMDKFFEKQMTKLQVEYIDYYLLHTLDGALWNKMKALGVFDFMDSLKASGKVKHIGFSYHGTREDFKSIIDEYDWDFCQIQFNILDENYQAGLEGLNYATSKNIGVVAMEPLRGGQLVGKIPTPVQQLWDKADIKRSPADWALRWIWNHPGIITVLSGMNMDEHIKENIKVASQVEPESLTSKELSIINEVRDTYADLLKVGCTGCRYCIPCPVGIDIPHAFHTYNNYHMFDGKFALKMMYANITGIGGEKVTWTSKCIDCGKCEEACPQHIKIRKEFKGVQRDIETRTVRTISKIARKLVHRK